jgi:hypothetical protein
MPFFVCLRNLLGGLTWEKAPDGAGTFYKEAAFTASKTPQVFYRAYIYRHI